MGYKQRKVCRHGHNTYVCGRTKAGACKACVKVADIKYRSLKNPIEMKLARRRSDLKLCYGITLEQYNTMFLKQKGLCLGCCRHQSYFKRRLAVDHCHKTGRIRGLLCVSCNHALGLVREDIPTLLNLVNYIKEK
jgi:hypothetical protein